MAIPGWLWPDSSFRDRQTQPSSNFLEGSEIENATNLFEVLSNRIRLEILGTLYSQSAPITYTDLRDATSVSDKGKFNYHLRQLDQLVQNQDGKYTLSERGEELIQSVATEDQLRQYK